MKPGNITHHIECSPEDFAKTVLMPGDPLRAKMIADNFLTDVDQINSIRGMLGYTGFYKGKRISVLASGMGLTSMGTMSYELFNMFGVETIIRVGTAGGIDPSLKVLDLVIAEGACTDSNYEETFELPGRTAPIATYELLERAAGYCRENGIQARIGNLLSAQAFYVEGGIPRQLTWRKVGVLAVENETAALYLNAMRAHKRALSICTITDLLEKHVAISALERQESVKEMIRIALEIADY